jgi:4-amino-4-deoxy-L-arabinose transferase-like glycosyltransferase
VWRERLKKAGIFFEINRNDAPAFCSAAIIIFSAVIIFSKISLNALNYFDDAYYAEKAKEILTTGDMWLIHFAGNITYDNPPLHFWITAFFLKIFGINEFGVRFPSAIFVLMTMILCYRMTAFVFNDKWAGFFSVLTISTTYFFVSCAFRGMLDAQLVFFEMLSIYVFMHAMKKDNLYIYATAGIFTGLAILTKSVLGAYPIAVLGLYFLASGKWQRLFSPGFLLYVFAALAISSPWYIYNFVQSKGAFLNVHFGDIIGGMAGKTGGGIRFKPGYILALFSYGLPWMPAAIYGSYEMVRREWKKNADNIFIIIIIWAWLIIIGLSFTEIIKTWYIMPAFAACALISGYLLSVIFKNNEKIIKTAVTIYALIVFVMVMLPIDLNGHRSNDVKTLAPFVKALVPQGGSVINYKMGYWQVQNPLIFYSGVSFSDSIENPELLIAELEKGGIAMAETKELEDSLKPYRDKIYVIAVADNKALFCLKSGDIFLKQPLYNIKLQDKLFVKYD